MRQARMKCASVSDVTSTHYTVTTQTATIAFPEAVSTWRERHTVSCPICGATVEIDVDGPGRSWSKRLALCALTVTLGILAILHGGTYWVAGGWLGVVVGLVFLTGVGDPGASVVKGEVLRARSHEIAI